MYSILFLFHTFQYAKSVNMYELKMRAVDAEHLIISFRVKGNDLDQLNGNFSVHKGFCRPDNLCGFATASLPISDKQRITIRTGLSPCRNYSRIEIRCHKKNASYGHWMKDWRGESCTAEIKNQNNLIFSVVFLAFVNTTVIAIVIFLKKKMCAKKRKAEEMTTDECPVYGIYDDGPLYNVVSDQNDYYSTL